MVAEILQQFTYSFLATIGFAILFSIPKNCTIKSGICGAIGWIIYFEINKIYSSLISGAFFGALAVGILGEILAKHFKKPATTFIVPGIIPLVPGAGMYYTMLALMEKKFYDCINKGTETLFIAVGIATGIIISSLLSKSIKKVRKKNI